LKKELTVKEILCITMILSFCSIIYELIFANTLSLLTGSYIWWHSWTIGFYIGGLGIGAIKSGKLLNSFRELYYVELLLSLIGCLSVIYIFCLHLIFKSSDYMSYLGNDFYSASYVQVSFYMNVFFFCLVQSITLIIGILSGFEIPLLIKLMKEKTGKDKENLVLGVNYIGTLFGTLIFSFILLPKLDIIYTSVIVATLNLLVCLYLLIKRRVKRSPAFIIPITCVILVLVFVGKNENLIQQNYLKVRYHGDRVIARDKSQTRIFLENLDQIPDVLRMKSLYQYIDFFDIETTNKETETIMTLDGNFQFSSKTERFYHEGFAHVGLELVGFIPKKILILGGGDGLLIRELLKYPEIEIIEQIELDDKILKLAKKKPFLTKLNENSLSNPRVKTVIGDGFHYMRNTTEKFDAIFIDFPYPRNYNLARLYSVEFYTYVKRNLTPNGFVILDTPIVEKKTYTSKQYQGRMIDKMLFSSSDKYNNNVILSTMYYSGFKRLLPYKVGEESFLIMHNRDKEFQYQNLLKANSKFQKVSSKDLVEISGQNFPYEIKKKYINSIFKPTILGLSDF
jgi:spermidine synthase